MKGNLHKQVSVLLRYDMEQRRGGFCGLFVLIMRAC